MKGPCHHRQQNTREADRSAVAPAWKLAPPHPMRSIGELHRAIGNHAVGRLLQRKLVVNTPGDVYEQEADRVADAVTGATPESPPPALGRASLMPRGLQRECSCGASCEDCRKADALQRKEGSIAVTGAGNAAPPIVHDVLRSPGQPLDAGTRAYMEPRFGRDFENVRVHIDARAAESARCVDAQAYTVANDVVFDRGRYAPHTPEGQRLLAHEANIARDYSFVISGAPINVNTKSGDKVTMTLTWIGDDGKNYYFRLTYDVVGNPTAETDLKYKGRRLLRFNLKTTNSQIIDIAPEGQRPFLLSPGREATYRIFVD
jgi:hypothetical protein